MVSGEPDWKRSVRLYGWDGTNIIPCLLDSNGNLIAIIKGDYAGTLKTVAVDDQGRMLANLAAQDLAQVVTRPGLGAREHAYMSNVTVPAGESVEIVDVEGSGYFYYLAACLYNPGEDIILHFWLDGEDFFDFWEEFPEWGEIEVTPYRRIAFTNASGTTSHGVLVYFNPPIAFDWQLRIKVFNSSMNDQKCAYEIYYTTL